jgi:hypothetical protein
LTRSQEYEKFTKAQRLLCLLAKVALIIPLSYALGTVSTLLRETDGVYEHEQLMQTGMLSLGAECQHACNCESTHCEFWRDHGAGVWRDEKKYGKCKQGDARRQHDGIDTIYHFCGRCAPRPDSQCSATRIVWFEPTGIQTGQPVTWADTCRASRLGPDHSQCRAKSGCQDRRARDEYGYDYDGDGVQHRMMADDFGGGNCTDCQNCSLWLSREVPGESEPVSIFVDFLFWASLAIVFKVLVVTFGLLTGLTT